MKVIGLAGTNGSGKDTVGYLLAEKYGYLFVSVSDILRVELRTRGREVTRENLRTLSAEWRREFGLGVLVDKAVALAEHAGKPGVVACPLRNVGEAQHLKKIGGKLLWVDADSLVRYQRIQSADRSRTGEDNKTYAEFLAEEQAEMHPSDPSDPAVLNMIGVKILADATITNESDLGHLHEALNTTLLHLS